MQPITAIIQARMGSTRLPGKILLDVEGKTVLERAVERTRLAKAIGRVIVAIPDDTSNDELAQFCEEKEMEFYRGSESDVLDRYYQAAKAVGAAHIARITSDCPLVDPKVIDRVADEYFKNGCDYISTGRLASSYPDGLDTEIFSFGALGRAWTEAKLPSEHEHVTPYIWNHPELFKIETVNYERDLSSLRWTVDEPRDLEFVRSVYRELGENMFYMEDILALLEGHPEIGEINSDIVRNSGYYKSLHQEEK